MAMNFFEHQEAARRTSKRLILLFAMAVIGIVVAVDFGVMVALGSVSVAPTDGSTHRRVAWGVHPVVPVVSSHSSRNTRAACCWRRIRRAGAK